MPEADAEEERRHPDRAHPAGRRARRRQPARRRPGERRRRATSACATSVTGSHLPLDREILHERVELRLRQARERLRHDVRRVTVLDVGVRVDDRLADERPRAACPACSAYSGSSSRSGPTVPVRARRLERVAAAAAVAVEDGRARVPGAADLLLRLAQSSRRTRPASITIAPARMTAWPEAAELGAEHRVLAELGRRDRECVVMTRAAASCFWRNSGTQNEWITSSAADLQLGRPVQRAALSSVEATSRLPGYLKLQANCCAVTSTSRVARDAVVLGERDGADDSRSRSRAGRDGRPGDLEARVPVDRRAVGVVVGPRAELQTGVDRRPRDDREDDDADRRRRTRRRSRSARAPATPRRAARARATRRGLLRPQR